MALSTRTSATLAAGVVVVLYVFTYTFSVANERPPALEGSPNAPTQTRCASKEIASVTADLQATVTRLEGEINRLRSLAVVPTQPEQRPVDEANNSDPEKGVETDKGETQTIDAPEENVVVYREGVPSTTPPLPSHLAVVKAPPEGGYKGIFIGLVGVEGVGHHLIHGLFAGLNCAKATSDFKKATDKKMKEIYFTGWKKESTKATNLRQSFVTALEDFDGFTETLTHVVDFEKAVSYPYGEPRQSLQRFDLIDGTRALQDSGYDVRYIVVYRDPPSAVRSMVKRWPSYQSVPFQAKVVEDNLMYMQSALRVLDSEFYRIVDYEELTNRPNDFATPLAEFFGVPEAEFRERLATVRASTKYNDNVDMQYLRWWFDETRCKAWSFITDRLNVFGDVRV